MLCSCQFHALLHTTFFLSIITVHLLLLLLFLFYFSLALKCVTKYLCVTTRFVREMRFSRACVFVYFPLFGLFWFIALLRFFVFNNFPLWFSNANRRTEPEFMISAFSTLWNNCKIGRFYYQRLYISSASKSNAHTFPLHKVTSTGTSQSCNFLGLLQIM